MNMFGMHSVLGCFFFFSFKHFKMHLQFIHITFISSLSIFILQNLDQSFNPPMPDRELCKLSAQLLTASDISPVKDDVTAIIKPEIQCAQELQHPAAKIKTINIVSQSRTTVAVGSAQHNADIFLLSFMCSCLTCITLSFSLKK